MVGINTIREEVVIGYRSEGADRVVADAKRIDAANAKVAAGEGVVAVQTERTASRRLSLRAGVERFQRSIDLEYRASRRLADAQELLNRAYYSGQLTLQRHTSLMRMAQSRHDDAIAKTRRLASANDNAAASFAAMGSRAIPILGLLGTALAAIGGAALVGGIAKAGMEMESLERGFAAAAGSAQQGGRELTFIRATSDRLGLSLQETSRQYLSMVAASRGTALQGKDTREVFEATVMTMTALGRGNEETGRALTALSQMMSKGKVSAEEMNGQLGEALPGALSMASKAMGKTQQELLKLMEDGKLLAKDLLPKLAAEMKRTYGGAADEAAQKLGANLNRMSTAWTDFQAAAARGGLNDALSRSAGDLASFLNDNQAAAASFGQTMAGAVDGLRAFGTAAVDAYDSVRIIIQMLGELDKATTYETPLSSGSTFDWFSQAGSGIAEASKRDINTLIGNYVQARDIIVATWNALPAAFAEIGAGAANLLISAIEWAINKTVGGFNAMVDRLNSIGSYLPGFSAIEKAAEVSFDRVKAASSGTVDKLEADIAAIQKSAHSRDYLGEAGTAITSRFNELKEASAKARAEAKKLADQVKADKLADMLNHTGDAANKAGADLDKAGKGAKGAAAGAREAQQEFSRLKGEAEQAFKKLFPEDALRKQGQELQGLLDRYRDQLAKVDPRYVTAIETQIKLNLEGKELEGVKAKAEDLSSDLSQTFRGVFDDMFTNAEAGFSGLLQNVSQGLARIGSRQIEARLLTPAMSGELDFGKLFDFDRLEKAVALGSEAGTGTVWDNLTKPKAGAGFMSSPLGSAIMPTVSGAAIGYSSQSPLMGAFGGALTGLASGNPLLAAAGPALGFGGVIGKRRATNDNPKPDTDQEKPVDDRDQRPLAA